MTQFADFLTYSTIIQVVLSRYSKSTRLGHGNGIRSVLPNCCLLHIFGFNDIKQFNIPPSKAELLNCQYPSSSYYIIQNTSQLKLWYRTDCFADVPFYHHILNGRVLCSLYTISIRVAAHVLSFVTRATNIARYQHSNIPDRCSVINNNIDV